MTIELPPTAARSLSLLKSKFPHARNAILPLEIRVPASAIFDPSKAQSPAEQLLRARHSRRKLLSILRWFVSEGVSVRLGASRKTFHMNTETRMLLEEIVPGICGVGR